MFGYKEKALSKEDRLIVELREQVNCLMAAMQVLAPMARRDSGEKADHYLAMVYHVLFAQMRMVEHADYAREGFEPYFQPILADFAGKCREVCRQAEGLLRDEPVEFQWEDTLGSAVTMFDPQLLERATLNLVSNAVKMAGPDGQVKLKTHKCGNQLCITVWDSGTQTQQEPSQLSPEQSGLGVGLEVVRKITALHGGAAVMLPCPEEGTKAVLSFPVTQKQELELRTPSMGYDGSGGFVPVLVELADVLSDGAYNYEQLQ